MSNKCTSDEDYRDELRQRTSEWASSKEGREALKKASKNSREIIAKLEKDLQIDPRILDEPITL